MESAILAYERHKENMKEASRKYYAKINRRDFTDKNGKLWEFSKLELTDDAKKKHEERMNHKKNYHKQRYMNNSEKFIQQARDYRKAKKAEKEKAKESEPVQLVISTPVPV